VFLAGVLLLNLNTASAHWTFPRVISEEWEDLCFQEAHPLNATQVVKTALALEIDLSRAVVPGRRLRCHEHLSNISNNEIRTGNYPASALKELCHGDPRIISFLFLF